MALLHRATLTPTKQELVESWLPSRSWAWGPGVIAKVAEYRFDDPAGEVGVETILWDTGAGGMIQTPLTYRSAPLEPAERFLIGTTEHSVLGTRWVYDGCGDPVWAQTLTAAIATGGSQAPMYLEDAGGRVDVPARMRVRGSGDPGAAVPAVRTVDEVRDEGAATLSVAQAVELLIARVLGAPLDQGQDAAGTLIGRIGDDGDDIVLAVMRLR